MEARYDWRVVLVHDWLTGMRGGEKVLEVFCSRFPSAQLYTLLQRRGSVSAAIQQLQPRTSFLQWFPQVHRYYRYLLPLMPLASRFRLPGCDLVVSCSHCVAKGAMAPPGVPHVCYCLTPMRYAWHMKEAYFADRRWSLKGWLVEQILARLRHWDRATADGVTHFLAISRAVQQRIRDCYDRDSTVIYPPVDTDFYSPAVVPRQDYYLVVSAFAPYKRLDLAVQACNRLGRNLVVIGTGQDEARVRAMAGPTVQILGWQTDEAIRDHLRRCRALLFPGEEDFGIVPVEAQACGCPVIALARGGATETVVPLDRPFTGGRLDEPTGVWFDEQTPECLAEAMTALEKNIQAFSPGAARRQALRFNRQRFEAEFFGYLERVMAGAPQKAAKAA